MAQPKPKKKRRSRSDPVRRAAAARRDEARRLAAEQRRREHEANERRQKIKKTIRRLAVPVLVGIGVVVAAIFLFRPQREVAEVDQNTTTRGILVGVLTYSDLPAEIDEATLPDPECGAVEDPTGLELYSALRNGAVAFFFNPDDSETRARLDGLATANATLVVVASNGTIAQGEVVAVAWERWKRYSPAPDADLQQFIDYYRGRVTNNLECPTTTG
jgi:hypothetical protein